MNDNPSYPPSREITSLDIHMPPAPIPYIEAGEPIVSAETEQSLSDRIEKIRRRDS